MLPIIIEKTKIDDIDFFSLNTGQILFGLKLSVIDREKPESEIDLLTNKLADFYSNISNEIQIKFILNSELSFREFDLSRKETLKHYGFIQNDLYFFAFIKENSVSSIIKMFSDKKSSSSFDILALKLKSLVNLESIKDTFDYKTLTETDLELILPFVNRNYIEKLNSSVDLGSSLKGYVRLNKLGTNSIDQVTLANLKDALPTPYKIILNCKKMSQIKSENLLKTKTNQAGQTNSKVGSVQYQEAQNKMEQVQLYGAGLVEFEFLIELTRFDEKTIREDADKVIQILRPLGDFYFETFGCFKTFLSSLPNGEIHYPVIETSAVLPFFTPVVSYGQSTETLDLQKSSLALHREDYSPYFLNIYDRRNENYSCAVVGKSGMGKSFFTNILTRSLHSDPDISIIKIDVGSSHSRETQMLGGAEYNISLDKPSGINPFFILNNLQEINLDYIALISTFLKSLISDKSELAIPKEIVADIEFAVTKYAEMKPSKASIDDFLEKIEDIPRKKLLERWSSKGNFRNAFKTSSETAGFFSNRLKYFDMKNVLQAQDKDFGTGALAAVMAQFNIEMMKINEYNKKNGTSKKLVFMADETPVFIKDNFELFAFTAKNVRKFGGSLIPIVQKSTDLVVNGDTSIIDNCASKVLFSIDGEKSQYAKLMNLDENSREMKVISSLVKQQNKSKFMFLNSQGARLLNVYATRTEFWSATSTDTDKAKIQQLMNNVQGLTLEEAIRCLSIS